MDKIKQVIDFLTKLYHERYFGEITLKFEAGIPTIAYKIRETVKF